MEIPSGQTKRPDLDVVTASKSPPEIALLTHIREVNDKRLELEYESLLLNRHGDVAGSVRKKKACEEARRYLNTLVAKHKRLYSRRPARD